MRTAFIDTLYDLARRDPRIMLVVGDLGFGVVDRFARDLPNQFLNAGVAEQNMTGVAAGLAMCGKTVVTYSIGNFPLLRCVEQVRNDICYHNANVKIVCVGGGLAYGALGMSHHATEDLAVARALPNLTVVAPNDAAEAAAATRAIIQSDGPCYLRLGRSGEASVLPTGNAFVLGKAVRVRDGRDVMFIAGGGLSAVALEAAEELSRLDIDVGVLSVHTLKPLDQSSILTAASEASAVFTIEEHSRYGGLGGAVSELLMEHAVRPLVFARLGLDDQYVSVGGAQGDLRARFGLDASGIVRSVCQMTERV